MRSEIQRKGALSGPEIALLKKTALDCNGREKEFQNGVAARIPDLATQSRGAGQAAERAKADLASLNAARDQIITDCVSQLKAALGAKRFGQLHAFAEAFVKPRLTYSDGKSSGAPPRPRQGEGGVK
jgi:hypothetical protein